MRITRNQWHNIYAGNGRIVIVLILLTCLVVLQTGCVLPSSLQHREHPLAGKLWDVRQQAFIDMPTLVSSLLDSDFVLLGEQHDNPVHHAHQAWVIHELANARREASVAFEMIDNYQADRLARQRITSADQLITLLNRSKTSWDYAHQYRALFAEVISAGYRIDSANLQRDRLMHTVRQGEDKLPPAYKRMLDQTPMSATHMNALQQDIKQSHCGMLDDNTSRKMILGQRVRDSIMAHSLLKSPAPIKVLIAGAGHVRNDRAVPAYLRTGAKEASILSIGMVEVEAGVHDAPVYAERFGSDSLPFDIVWFTPQVKREDLCASLRQHFKRKSE